MQKQTTLLRRFKTVITAQPKITLDQYLKSTAEQFVLRLSRNSDRYAPK